MAKLTIHVEAEGPLSDMDLAQADAVTLIETALGYMFNNVFVTSNVEEGEDDGFDEKTYGL